MRTLLVATTNPGKLREIRALMSDAPVRLVEPCRRSTHRGTGGSRRDVRGERASKARHYARAQRAVDRGAKIPGLVIDALGGEPGVLVSSLSPSRCDRTRNDLLKSSAASMHLQASHAALASSRRSPASNRGEVIYETTGVVEGAIADAPRGRGGFGYDPIFFYPPYGRTLAEVSDAEKIAVAHRGVAFRKFADWLKAGRNDERRTMLFSVRHPESGRGRWFVREFEGRASWPVGLTAREVGTAPTAWRVTSR